MICNVDRLRLDTGIYNISIASNSICNGPHSQRLRSKKVKSKAGTWDVSSLGHQTPWMMLAFNIRYPDARRNFGSLNNLNMFSFKLHLPVLNSHAGSLLDVSNLDSGFGTFWWEHRCRWKAYLGGGKLFGRFHSQLLGLWCEAEINPKWMKHEGNSDENEGLFFDNPYHVLIPSRAKTSQDSWRNFFLATPQKRTLQFFKSKMFEAPNNSTLPTCGHQRHTKTKLKGSWQSGWAFMPWRSGARKVFLEMVIRSAVWERSTNLGNIWKDYIDI